MTNPYSKGILQPDGTRCYSGPECSLHGGFNKAVVSAMQENMDEFVQSAMEDFMSKRDYIAAHGASEQELAALHEGESQYGTYAYDAHEDKDDRRYLTLPVDYAYDTVEEPAGNYYGKYDRIVNGRVNLPVDLAELADYLYRPKTDTARGAAIAYLREEGFTHSEAYEVGGNSGWYGETPYIKLTDESASKAEAYFRQFPNAQDAEGYYDRARAYGLETKGLAPQQAFLQGLSKRYGKKLPQELREQLAADAKANGYWAKKTTVSINSRSLATLKVDEAQLAKVKAAPELPSKKEPAGVILMRENQAKDFEIIEGLENYKALSESTGSAATKRRAWITVVMPPKPKSK